MEKLLKQIEGLIIEKSLSLDVIEIVRKIQAEHATVMGENKSLLQKINHLEEEKKLLIWNNDKLTNDKTNLKTELDAYKARDVEFKNSEHTLALKNKDVDSSERALMEVKNVVTMVFKNTIIREGINKSSTTPVSVNGYVQNSYSNETYNKDTQTIPE